MRECMYDEFVILKDLTHEERKGKLEEVIAQNEGGLNHLSEMFFCGILWNDFALSSLVARESHAESCLGAYADVENALAYCTGHQSVRTCVELMCYDETIDKQCLIARCVQTPDALKGVLLVEAFHQNWNCPLRQATARGNYELIFFLLSQKDCTPAQGDPSQKDSSSLAIAFRNKDALAVQLFIHFDKCHPRIAASNLDLTHIKNIRAFMRDANTKYCERNRRIRKKILAGMTYDPDCRKSALRTFNYVKKKVGVFAKRFAFGVLSVSPIILEEKFKKHFYRDAETLISPAHAALVSVEDSKELMDLESERIYWELTSSHGPDFPVCYFCLVFLN